MLTARCVLDMHSPSNYKFFSFSTNPVINFGGVQYWKRSITWACYNNKQNAKISEILWLQQTTLGLQIKFTPTTNFGFVSKLSKCHSQSSDTAVTALYWIPSSYISTCVSIYFSLKVLEDPSCVGPFSTRHGASPGCGWGKWLPFIQDRWVYTEYGVAHFRYGVVLQLQDRE